jgi:hypothetical protein
VNSSRADALSALSGCAWAGIAYVIGHEMLGRALVGGILAAPVIGILVGRLYRPAYRLSLGGRAIATIVTFYIAIALFGLAVGLYDAYARPVPGRIPSAVVSQDVIGTVWGVTWMGYVVVLWPLAHFNHWLVGRLSEEGG